MTGPLLTASALAKKLDKSKQAVYRWRAQEGLPSVSIGRSVFFIEADVDRWLESRTSGTYPSQGEQDQRSETTEAALTAASGEIPIPPKS